jgi:S1-C subfamily serine protease
MSYYRKILVDDDGIAVRMDSELLKGERMASVIMEPERPIEFGRPKSQPLTIAIPRSAIGTIHDLSNPTKSLGAGFVLDDPHFVITASSIASGADGNLRRLVYVTTDDAGVPVILPIEAYQTMPFTDIAIMKVRAEKIPQGTLTRGNSEKLDSGDLVAYSELVLGEDNKRVFRFNANRIERISRQNGVRIFAIRGPLKSEFVGGPLLAGGNTVVGVVTKVNLAESTSTFYALDIQAVPNFP